MSEYTNPDWSKEGAHPPEDDLRVYADGELEREISGLLKAHLDACWSCRVKLDEVQSTIADFIGYRNQVLRTLVPPPPKNWRGFDTRLDQSAAAVGSRRRPPLVSPLTLRFAAALLIVLAAIVSWVVFNREPMIAATELLDRAVQAQTQQVVSTAQPVVHQQIQVRRKRSSAPQPETVRVDTWNDLNNARFKQSSFGETKPQELLVTLERVFEANSLDWRRPLSAASFAGWRNSLGTKTDKVRRTSAAGEGEMLSLTTTSTGTPQAGAVVEATLAVRATDWHTFKEELRVQEESGEAEYELTETAFEIVSLATVDSKVFVEGADTPSTTTTPLIAARSIAPDVSRPVSASLALEIETLALLAQAGADLGEQISVTREPDGALKVEGIVETARRKEEILRALGAVMHEPAVRLDINTVEEALRQRPPQAQTGASVTVAEAASNSIPADAELRRYLAVGGTAAGQMDEEVRRFANAVVNRSRQAMFHAAAMKRLADRFTLEQVRAFDEESRAKWLALIRQHALTFRRESAALREELSPLFANAPTPAASQVIGDGGADALIRAVSQLFERSTANYEAIQSAFTISTIAPAVLTVRSPQFWQSLQETESLAQGIVEGGR